MSELENVVKSREKHLKALLKEVEHLPKSLMFRPATQSQDDSVENSNSSWGDFAQFTNLWNNWSN